jgi:type I restriction enzyme, S subunit
MKCVLKDLIAVSKDGEWGKGESFGDSVEMLAIRGTDFEDVRFGFTDSTPRRHIAKRHAERKLLQPWDVIIEAAGGTKNQITGRTVLLRPQLFSRSELPFTCASFSRFIRFNTELCDPSFMFWYLQHLYASGLMHAYHTQHTGVARFQWTTFSEREPLEIPSLSVQRRIAGFLSAYDEMMENSQRRIRLLEAMSRALYRAWFVHFRFPGHQKIKQVDSSLGKIPHGWEVKPFTEIADVLSGGTPKTDVAEYWNGEIPFFTPRDTPDCFYVQDTEKHVTELGLSKCASELYSPDTVFITARGTVGKVALPSVPMAMNQSCYALRGKPGIPQRFLFLMTLQQVDYLKTNTGGATFDTIVVDTFRRMEVVNPAREIIARFARQTDAIFEQVNTLQRQIQNLRRTRDLLLPRLLSGQVELETEAA